MNLYEWEGKKLFSKYGIAIPRGVIVRRGDDFAKAYRGLQVKEAVAKAQVLCGKRGKNNGVRFCTSAEEAQKACAEIFNMNIRGQYVSAVLMEEKLEIVEEHYLSITYDTTAKQPMAIYSSSGGMDVEEVDEKKIVKFSLSPGRGSCEKDLNDIIINLRECFIKEDCRLVEINPLVKTKDGRWMAADAKIALDDDASFRHPDWQNLESRTMLGRLPTEREELVKKIDEGENYYRGTAGKYIEMDGDIGVLFSGGGASIANMDALQRSGLKAANYTEYSGNPPRKKVYQLAKIVLSKPGLKGLWIAGGVANFTDIAETFHGIIDALDEIKPRFPIVVRRAGPNDSEGMSLMRECAERNGLKIKLFGKEVGMGETACELASMLQNNFKLNNKIDHD